MNLNNNNNLIFTSRNSTIRFADDIARKVNKEYPRISSTKLDSFKYIGKYKQLQTQFWHKVSFLRKERNFKFHIVSAFIKKIDSILDPIKAMKVGNCAESAYLSAIVARLNGIKNCYIARIEGPNKEDFDHAVLYVADKKPYIIDAWLGFADYLPEAVMRYTKDFHNNFDFDKFHTEKMLFKKNRSIYTHFFGLNFSPDEIAQIKSKHPELLIKKRDSNTKSI